MASSKVNAEGYIKSGAPFVYYVWILLSVSIFIAEIFARINFLYALFIFLIIATILFVVIAQYSCSFICSNDKIRFKYLFPSNEIKEISLVNIDRIEFELSYFYFLEEDFKMGVFYWFRPYDTMYIFYQNEKLPMIIKFNASFKGAKKMYKYLKLKYHKPYWEKV